MLILPNLFSYSSKVWLIMTQIWEGYMPLGCMGTAQNGPDICEPRGDAVETVSLSGLRNEFFPNSHVSHCLNS